jgi:DNA replication and repair protein RecF
MFVRELRLDEFRSFRSLHLELESVGFRAVGANASGKSTLLEALAMLATTRSPRTSSEREVANWSSGEELGMPPYARVEGTVVRGGEETVISIGISMESRESGPIKKLIRLDDRPVRAVDAIGRLNCVHFTPEDVGLISGTPAGRRRYLDIAISQSSRDYLAALSRYAKALEQRNSLLRAFMRGGASSSGRRLADEISFWDIEIVSAASEVIVGRLKAIAQLAPLASSHFADLTGIGSLGLCYTASRASYEGINVAAGGSSNDELGLLQAVSARLAAAFTAHRGEEHRRGVTVVGPHRDDFTVTVDGNNLAQYGSRGQQRLALVAIKLAELEFLAATAGEPPVLLLDDVLSELDARHRSLVITKLASRAAQTCVTATELADLNDNSLMHLPLLRVDNGTVSAEARQR